MTFVSEEHLNDSIALTLNLSGSLLRQDMGAEGHPDGISSGERVRLSDVVAFLERLQGSPSLIRK